MAKGAATRATTFRGSLPRIIRNTDRLYEGNLIAYFRIVFGKANNLRNPNHNFRHLMHVLYECYQACVFYKGELSPRQMRNLLIAAMFHDFNHSGKRDKDSEQVRRAIKALQHHALPPDQEHLPDILDLVCWTEYPYEIRTASLPLGAQILRDADLSQAMSVAWIQQVVFGLAEEWDISPIEVLRRHEKFLVSLRFATAWAQETFPEEAIDSKIMEAQELLALVEEEAL